jgi:hypothetical protein
LLKKQFFRIYFFEKVWKIIRGKIKDLTAKDIRFIKFQNYFLKQKPMENVYGSLDWVHGTDSQAHGIVDPSGSSITISTAEIKPHKGVCMGLNLIHRK